MPAIEERQALVHHPSVVRLLPVQACAHARMLRAATREHEGNGARPVGSLSAEHGPCVARRQRARSRFRAVRHDNPALDHLRAACLERPGDVRQQEGHHGAINAAASLSVARSSAPLVRAEIGHDLPVPGGCTGRDGWGWLLQHDMGVGAAYTQRAHPCAKG